MAAGLPLIKGLFGNGELQIFQGLGAVAAGGVTAVATFLAVSYLLRAPELRDLTTRKS